MKLYFLKQKSLDVLEKEISQNLEKYESTDSWVDQYFISKETPNYYFDSEIEVSDYQLVLGESDTDFQNAKIIYEAFKGKLNPVQASDLRLWAYLAHVQHWDYMCKRWKIDVPDEEDEESDSKKSPRDKAVDRVGSRYFFKASKGKAFVRHGIARLYWSAYLTYDEDNENGNPYEYTEFFFSKQDIFTSITERSYARNKILVLAALKELKKYPDMSREEIRLFLAKLNQSGAITVLDFLDKEQAEELCHNVMNELHAVAALEEGYKFKLINNLTGKSYGPEFILQDGFATVLGKRISTKPRNLLGKKEGAKVIISGKQYVIKDIKGDK